MCSNRFLRIPEILFTVIFAGILFSSILFFLVKDKPAVSYYENRTLAQKPAFSYTGLWNGSYFNGWDKYLSDHSVGRETFIRTQAILNLKIFHRINVNGVVPTDDRLLVYDYGAVNPVGTVADIPAQSEEMALRCENLNQLVTSYGGYFLYAAVPGQTVYYADSYPWCVGNQPEMSLLRRNAFAAAMEKHHVPYIDINTVYTQLGSPENFFFYTDYHYSYTGAVAAYRAILQRVNQLSDVQLNILSEKDIALQTLSNPFIGSYSRMIYNLVSFNEHLVIGNLKTPIPFDRFDSGEKVNSSCYALPDNESMAIGYSTYMGGDKAETVIQTHRENLPNVLIFGDSFTNPIETLLYASCNEMRSLDLRHYTQKSLFAYIEEFKPDIVLCVRDYYALLSTEGNGAIE